MSQSRVRVEEYDFIIKTYGPNGVFDIMPYINEFLYEVNASKGLLVVECMGSTGALLLVNPKYINEIKENELWTLVPVNLDWQHEGNAYAHLRSTVLGTQIVLPVRNGSLAIGDNKLYFIENQCYTFRERHIYLMYMGY